MDWRLLDYAKEAEETASGLHTFVGEIPQYSKDITGDIAELFAISSALRTLHESLVLNRYERYIMRIESDLDVVLPSLGYTLDDVREMFSKSRRTRQQPPGAFPGTPPYHRYWERTCRAFTDEGLSLPIRLQNYRTFLQGLDIVLRGKQGDEEVDLIRPLLARLLRKQRPVQYVPVQSVPVYREPLDSYFSGLNLGDPRADGSRTPMPRLPDHARPMMPPYPESHSPDHLRPGLPHYQTYPNPNYGPPLPPPPPPATFPPRFQMMPPYIVEVPHVPPPVPEIPQSPTYSSASSLEFSTISNDSNSGAHWAMKIFDGRHSSMSFQILDQPATRCLGRDEPQAVERLDEEGFQKVLELPFEATDVWVRLYWRQDDERARILILTMDPSGRRMRHCFPLTALKVLRSKSCLQLCRVNREDGELDLWANLRFTLYERMVLFYCTLVAMKRQDKVPTSEGLDDFFYRGEKEEYAGEINDQNQFHVFRIWRDRDSGGVRFEATARRGPLKTVPIWTAFVTKYIGHRSWMKLVGHATVQFKELHPYVFHQGYNVPRGPDRRFQLTFTTPNDARNFMEMFHHIKKRKN